MEKSKISVKQGAGLIVLFIVGTSALYGNYTAGVDAWTSPLLAALATAVLYFIYLRLTRIYPDKNLYEIVYATMGKPVGMAITFLYLFYSVHLAALILRDFTEFMKTIVLVDTPVHYFEIFIIILVIYSIKAGMQTLAKYSAIVFILMFVSIVTTVILATGEFNTDYIQPILYNNWSNIFKAAVSSLSFPFGETVLFLSFLPVLQNRRDNVRSFYIGLAIGTFLLFIAAVRNILVLGLPVLTHTFFPSLETVRILKVGNFIQRFEVIIGVIFLAGGFVKLTVSLYSACISASKLFGIQNQRHLAVPLGLTVLLMADILYNNASDLFGFLKVYTIYAIPFYLILPVIILITALIRKAIEKKRASGSAA